MPGKNPDPAESLDILEVIKETFHRDLAPKLASVVATEVAKVIPNASAGAYETRTLPEVTTPTLILGQDRQRKRALIASGVAFGWYIGTYSQLASIPVRQSGLTSAWDGYPVAGMSAAGIEIRTTEELYAVYAGATTPGNRLYAWIERDVY